MNKSILIDDFDAQQVYKVNQWTKSIHYPRKTLRQQTKVTHGGASAPPQLPAFWENRPALWIRDVEAKFSLFSENKKKAHQVRVRHFCFASGAILFQI